jgi:hypothetical protein
MKTFVTTVSVWSFYFLLSTFAFPQGSLTPPAAPTPTMKALDQVEPRTPIDATHTPGDANNAFVIGQPGSYYLTSNLGVAATNGIHVTAAGVTIDLNGFQISRIFASFGSGILIDANAQHCTVKNGSISGFAYGVEGIGNHGAFFQLLVFGASTYGLYVGDGWRFEGCTAHDNAGAGMWSGDSCIFANCIAHNNQGYGIITLGGCALTNCTAYSNQNNGMNVYDGTLINCVASNNVGSAGIKAGNGCALINCAASNNTATSGIEAGYGCTLSNCSAYYNSSGALSSYGILCAGGSVISHCTASSNKTTAGSATATTGGGIFAGYRSTVSNCIASENQGDGIGADYQCHIFDNTCNLAGVNGDGACIHTTGDHNVIEHNNVVNSPRGIEVASNGNLITANKSGGNPVSNYVIAASNHYGPIIDIRAVVAPAVNGSTAVSSTVTSADPWANFSY